ncbi:MAG: grasp-with-spasm system SPASM domain peptide maturase [Bacteroidetes bacterium]|nr:grasp-with-spasm system SPASM domain peptide maturase [Bacteroidota bacterium]
MAKHFVLYASCIPVKGYTNSLICDLQRGAFKIIPNSLFEILTVFKRKTLDEITSAFPASDHETIEEYFDFLLENDFGFWTSTPENFPELELNYETASLISNSIIDTNEESNHDYKNIFSQLDYLGCKSVQLRFFNRVDKTLIENTLVSLNGLRMSVELILKHSDFIDSEFYDYLLNKYQRVVSIIVHSANEDTVKGKGFNGIGQLIFLKQAIESSSHCGDISPLHFSINIETFTEALSNNSCLNKKISVDVDGAIKNCPSMAMSYGNIKSNTLIEVLGNSNSSFKTMWSIKKDQILVCRDCEFRYICTDCRAYLKESSNIFSKPLKCGYDPYTGTWD